MFRRIMYAINKYTIKMYNKFMSTKQIKKNSKKDFSKILRSFREVSQTANDMLKQSIIDANLNIEQQKILLIYQLIDTAINNAWGNSENTILRLLNDLVKEEQK